MSKPFYLTITLFALLCTTSCTLLERKQQQTDSNSVSTTYFDNGKEWINIKYHQMLSETHSPALSQNSCYYSFITLLTDTASFILNFHEGEALPLIAVDDAHYRIYNSWNEADSLDLYYLNDTLFLVGNEVHEQFIDFKRVSTNTSIQAYVAQKSIAGSYISEDKSKEVLFTPEGTVTGFDSFIYYDVAIDLIALSDQIDFVTLINKQGEKSYYAWKREESKLHLYAIPTELEEEIVTQELLQQCKVHYTFTLQP